MKVLNILNELKPSGAEVMIGNSASLYKERGFEIEVLSTGEKVGVYAEVLKDKGIIINHIPFLKSTKQLLKYYKFMRENKFDVIHVHCERASLFYEIIAKFVGTKSIVRTVHSNFNFTGTLRVRRILTRKISKLIGVKSISISKSVFETEKDVLKNETILIDNWVDESRFLTVNNKIRNENRRELNIEEDEFVLVSVGNCSEVKNHKYILRALSYLNSDFKYKYFHIGLEDSEYSERKLCDELKLNNNVEFCGYRDDIQKVLYSSDCFIMTSIYEGLGNSAIEAMCIGIPIILSDVIGLRDFKEFNSNIIKYVDLDNIKTCIKAILELSNMDLADRLSEGRELSLKVRKKHNKKDAIEKYIEVYTKK